MWLPRPGAGPGWHDKPIPLQADEMRTNTVIGKPQFGRELLDCSIPLPKQAEDLPACAFDKPLTPW
jgi:hypothetical protein